MAKRVATESDLKRSRTVIAGMQAWIRKSRPFTVAELLEIREIRAIIRLLSAASEARDGEHIDEIIDLLTQKAIYFVQRRMTDEDE